MTLEFSLKVREWANCSGFSGRFPLRVLCVRNVGITDPHTPRIFSEVRRKGEICVSMTFGLIILFLVR